jgi:hypothetical protein
MKYSTLVGDYTSINVCKLLVMYVQHEMHGVYNVKTQFHFLITVKCPNMGQIHPCDRAYDK